LPAAVLRLQGAAGNHAVSGLLNVQRVLQNDATWDPVEPITGQGKGVVAVVDPKVKYGSGPGTKEDFRPRAYQQMFSLASKVAAYCQGHLLNDNLGGPGDPAHPNAAQNLTPFLRNQPTATTCRWWSGW